MGIVLRQSAKSTIILSIGVLLGALLNYTYTFVFEKPELGFITNIVNQAALTYALVLMGTASVVMAYAPRFAHDDEKRKVLLTISLFFPLITMAVFTLLYFLFKENIIGIYNKYDQHYIRKYYYWLPVIILAWMYTTLLEHYLISKKKAALSTLIREVIHRACMVVLTALFFFKKIEFPTFVMLMSLSYLLPFIIALVISIRSGGLGLSLNFKVFSWQEYKQLIHFSWYHMLEGAAVIMLGYIDSLMLAPLATEGMSSLSVYRNAIFVTTLMIIPLRAINASSYAVLNEAYIKNEIHKLKDLYSRVNLNIIIIGILVCTLIISNVNNLVRILPAGYEQIKPVVFILLIGKMFQTASGMSSEVISFSKYYRFNFRISLLLLLMIAVLNRILIPEYGIEGAAWGATISVSVFSIAKAIFLQKKLQLSPVPPHTAYAVMAGIIASLAGIMLPFTVHVIPDVIIRSAIVVMLYGGIILRFTPDSDLSLYIKNIIRTKRLF